MKHNSIIPEWFVPSQECVDWLQQAAYKAMDKALEAHRCGLLHKVVTNGRIGQLLLDAQNEARNARFAYNEKKRAEAEARRREKDLELIRKYGYCPALFPDWKSEEVPF